MRDHPRHLKSNHPWIGFTLIFPIIFTLLAYTLPAQFNQISRAAAQGSHEIFLPVVSTTGTITFPSVGSDWTQEARDAQHTGFISDEPTQPWSLAWTWNGSDSGGGTGGHFYDAPQSARTITGGDFVYVPAGSNGLYAVSKSNGSEAWHFSSASINATPAYDVVSGAVLAGGADGTLYKIDSYSGNVQGTYSAGSGLNKAVMIGSGYAYVTSDDGKLHKVNINSMSAAWVYNAGSPATLPPAMSKAGVIVFGTADLYVHAVNDSDGGQAWRVKPTSISPSDTHTYAGYWPVIAEKHGIVFIRLNLGMEALWSGPGCGDWGCGVYPASNSETRSLLQADGGWRQNLFALNLNNGSEAFIPAVGFGGVEDLDGGGNPILANGPMPVIKVLDDGSEVAYVPFRSGQGSPHDGRWDTHLGEMVLDGSTIPDMQAGDVRFVQTNFTTNDISDEQTPLSMAGNTIFIAHWGASMSLRITDRSVSLGLSHDNPVQTESRPSVIRRQQSCGDFDPSSHWTSCGLTLYQDGRYWDGPGFWVYWNVMDPPTPPRGAYSEGLLPRYTYVADGMIIIEGNGGEIMALRYTP